MSDRRAGEIAVRTDALGRARVVKVRCVGEIAEEQQSILAAQFHEPVVIGELVFALFLLDPPPGEVLPTPLDPRIFHLIQDGFKIGRVGLEGGVDSKGRFGQQTLRKGGRRELHLEAASGCGVAGAERC